jgi:hypothetical protein
MLLKQHKHTRAREITAEVFVPKYISVGRPGPHAAPCTRHYLASVSEHDSNTMLVSSSTGPVACVACFHVRTRYKSSVVSRQDRLCGVVVRDHGSRSNGPGFDS